tara:strand:+ start:113 stop:991 length:879 start_codon:yes stop_codon:yes gene_type:complete
MKISAVIVSRNDNYGGHLNERAIYAINSAIHTYDEVFYIDWNSESHSLLYDIEDELQLKGNLNHIVIPPSIASQLTNYDPQAQKCCEVLARNIGIRRATGDYIVSTNIDIIQPKREDILELIKEKGQDSFTTVSRREVEWDYIKEFQGGDYNFSNWSAFRDDAYKTSVPRNKLESTTPGDEYSIINCCGDFQLASRNVWHAIKGFEEELIYPLYADTNVQKKAKIKGFNLTGQFSPPLFHINHGSKGWGGGGFAEGINKKANDLNRAITQQLDSRNEDTWGFSNINIESETF